MDITEKKINRQIQFWALVGPLITLLTFVVLLKKTTTESLYLPLLILVGFPICWKWKIKGFAASLGALLAFFVFSYGSIPIEDRVWQFGMGMAVTLSFAVTALSFEEVDALIRGLQVESMSRLTNLLNLDEKFKFSEAKLQEECEMWKGQVEAFQVKLSEKETFAQRQERLVEIMRSELKSLQTKHEGLLHELFQQREQVQKWQIEKAAWQPPVVDTREYDKQVADMGRLLNLKEKAVEQAEAELKVVRIDLEKTQTQSQLNLEKLLEEKQAVELNLSKLQIELDHVKTVPSEAIEKIAHLTKACEQSERELSVQKELYDEAKVQLHAQEINLGQVKQLEASKTEEIARLQVDLKAKINEITQLNAQFQALSQEKEVIIAAQPQDEVIPSDELLAIDRELRRVKGMHEQLKSQFHEKSQILDETRKQLFAVEEKLLQCQIEMQEKERYEYSEMEAELERQLIVTQKESRKIYQEACQEIETLHEIITRLMQPAQA